MEQEAAQKEQKLKVKEKSKSGTLNIDELLQDLDVDGDGDIDEQDKQLAATLRAMDKDGDGTIGLRELVSIGETRLSDKKKIKNLKYVIMGVIVGALVVMGVFLALMLAANEASKDSKPDKSGAMQTIQGKEITTSKTTTAVTLTMMPALELNTLDKVKDLRVQVSEGIFQKFTVVGYKWFSSAAMTFHTATGDSIIIQGGQVTVVDHTGGSSTSVLRKRRSLLAAAGDDQASVDSGSVEVSDMCRTRYTTLTDCYSAISQSDGCRWEIIGLGGYCTSAASSNVPCNTLSNQDQCHLGGDYCDYDGSTCIDTSPLDFEYTFAEAGHCLKHLS